MTSIPFTYPSHITWYGSLIDKETPFDVFGKSHRKKIRHTLKQMENASQYRFIIEQVTPEYLDQFVPLYKELIQSKKEGVEYNVHDRIMEGIAKGISYETISLYTHDVLVGGFLYALYDDYISTAYKTFPRSFEEKTWRCSPTIMAEYLLYDHAFKLHKKYIQHGRDLNQFGKYYAIGLAEFKLSLGCLPQPSKRKDTVWHDMVEYTPQYDQLVFIGDKDKNIIEKMVFITAKTEEETKENHLYLFSQTILPIEYYYSV